MALLASAEIVAFLVVPVVRWQMKNARFARGFDQIISVTYTTQIFLELTTGDFAAYYPKGYRENLRRPPLPFFVGAVLMLLGRDLAVMALANLLFLLAALFAVFLLAKRRGGDVAGLAALGLLLSSKAFAVFSLTWNTDMAGVAAVAWAILATERLMEARTPARIAALPVALAVGYFTRITFVFFLALPLAYAFLAIAFEEVRFIGKRALRRNLMFWLVVLGVFFACVAWWPKEYNIFSQIFYEQTGPGGVYAPFHTLQGDWFFADWWDGLGPLLIFAGLIGLVAGLFLDRERTGMMWAWILLPAVLFAYFAVNATRFFLPAAGALAVAGIVPLARLGRPARNVLGGVLFAAGLLAFFLRLQNPLITQPPPYGAGYENYDHNDHQVVEVIREVTGPVVLVDNRDQRRFALFPLPTLIALDQPKRPFFWMLFDNDIGHELKVVERLEPRLDEVSVVIVRDSENEPLDWERDRPGWIEFWRNSRKYGAKEADFKRVLLATDRVLEMVGGKTPVFQGSYIYGEGRFRIRVFRVDR